MVHVDVLIVGAGHAGAQAAIALRQRGFEGGVALLGDEPDPPYERPPLSKEYLSGDKPFERLLLRPAAFWPERKVDLLLGAQAVAVDAPSRRVATADGGTIGYGKLIWAAGGAPRRLACRGHDLAGVHAVRRRADVDRLIAELPATREVVVVGGGYIGLEAAAVLSKLGKRVTVLEACDRVLARVAAEPLSRFYEAEHRAHGVDIRLSATVDRIMEAQGRACGVRLSDGAVLPAQLVIVGIGIAPAVEPLLAAGAEGGNGVRVDAHCRTSLPDIYAVGDCAEQRCAYADGGWMRLESVENANSQATTAAAHICGETQPHRAAPWFWSNQYDLKLQTVGLSHGHDQVIVRGKPCRGGFSLVYLRAGRVIALDCVNAVRDYVQGKALVESAATIAPDLLRDPTLPLKEALARAVNAML